MKIAVFQKRMSNEGVEIMWRTDKAEADDLDPYSHTARDPALRAQPIQI